jgi:hypothetical protein
MIDLKPNLFLRQSNALRINFWSFPTENWAAEPWSTLPNDDQHQPPQPEDIDRSSPPHLLEQVIISEGTLNPSVTSNLVDVPTVVEHLPVAKTLSWIGTCFVQVRHVHFFTRLFL